MRGGCGHGTGYYAVRHNHHAPYVPASSRRRASILCTLTYLRHPHVADTADQAEHTQQPQHHDDNYHDMNDALYRRVERDLCFDKPEQDTGDEKYDND